MMSLADARRARDAARHQVTVSRVRVEAARGKCRDAAVTALISPTGLAGVFVLGWFAGSGSPERLKGRTGGVARQVRRTLFAALTSRRMWRLISRPAFTMVDPSARST